jgi:hypothetical protein
MKRTMTFALSGLLAFAGLGQAQYYPSSGAPGNAQRLINTPYPSQSRGTLNPSDSPSRGRLPAASLSGNSSNPEFAPLSYIGRLYVDTLGREPSQLEASYWMRQLSYRSRASIAQEVQMLRPPRWMGNYDPRFGGAYDPGVGSRYYPDPASLNFRDPSGPYFKSPYFPNYEYRRNMRAFPLGARG